MPVGGTSAVLGTPHPLPGPDESSAATAEK